MGTELSHQGNWGSVRVLVIARLGLSLLSLAHLRVAQVVPPPAAWVLAVLQPVHPLPFWRSCGSLRPSQCQSGVKCPPCSGAVLCCQCLVGWTIRCGTISTKGGLAARCTVPSQCVDADAAAHHRCVCVLSLPI